MIVAVKALAPTLGCEVRLRSPIQDSPELTDELTSLIDRYLVVVLRDHQLEAEEQIAITEWFGPCEQPWEVFARHPQHPCIHVLSTAKVPPRPYRTSSQHWHCDRSFLPIPTGLTFVHALTLPREESDTEWIDQRAALASLPSGLRRIVDRRSGVHDYGWKFAGLLARRVDRAAADAERVRFPPVTHPLVMRNPPHRARSGGARLRAPRRGEPGFGGRDCLRRPGAAVTAVAGALAPDVESVGGGTASGDPSM